MGRSVIVELNATAPVNVSADEIAKLVNQALDFADGRFQDAGINIGCASIKEDTIVADPNADEFQCSECQAIGDIDDSFKKADGRYLCESCHKRSLGLRNCPKCQADLTLYDSVSREYVDKDGGPSVFGLGFYMPDGSFEPSRVANLSGGRYDLIDDSDSCTACNNKI